MAKTDDEVMELPLPEKTFGLAGQERAELELLEALRSGRMHHAWMLTGPKGVGKATLAFRFARFLLRYGQDDAALAAAQSLEIRESDPVARQIASGTTQDLLVLRREVDDRTGKEKTEITVDVVRRLPPFFGTAAGAGGWRVAIIDPADDLNRNAANALLKSLEEPPRRTVLLLVTHAPGRLLPTIRSRCRKLALDPLPPALIQKEVARIAAGQALPAASEADDALLAKLAEGSLGRALELRAYGGAAQYRALLQTLKSWPNIPEGAIQQLVDAGLRRQWGEAFASLSCLIVDCVRSAARSAAGEGPPLDPALAALATGAPAWALADLAGDLEALFAKADGLNLDERAVISEGLRRIAAVRRANAA